MLKLNLSQEIWAVVKAACKLAHSKLADSNRQFSLGVSLHQLLIDKAKGIGSVSLIKSYLSALDYGHLLTFKWTARRHHTVKLNAGASKG
jgi:hypothetical protein